jgi:hypothetical protein
MLALERLRLGLEGLDPVIAFLSRVGPEDEAGVLPLGGGFVAFGDFDGFDDPAPAAVAVEDDLGGGGAFDCLQAKGGKGGGERWREMSFNVMK